MKSAARSDYRNCFFGPLLVRDLDIRRTSYSDLLKVVLNETVRQEAESASFGITTSLVVLNDNERYAGVEMDFISFVDQENHIKLVFDAFNGKAYFGGVEGTICFTTIGLVVAQILRVVRHLSPDGPNSPSPLI